MKAQNLTDKQFTQTIQELVDDTNFDLSARPEDSPCIATPISCQECPFSVFVRESIYDCSYDEHEKRLMRLFPEYFL